MTTPKTRITAGILAGLLLAGCFTGCSFRKGENDKDPDTPITITDTPEEDPAGTLTPIVTPENPDDPATPADDPAQPTDPVPISSPML